MRAAVESLAYQVHDVLEAMEQDSGYTIEILKADGGASANNFLLQFQADILDAQVDRPGCIETTALGAAYLQALQQDIGRIKRRFVQIGSCSVHLYRQ